MSSAVVLDDYDITPEEFESFLKVFYNPCVDLTSLRMNIL